MRSLVFGSLRRLTRVRGCICSYSSTATESSELVVKHLDGDLTGAVVIGLNRPSAMNSFSKNLLGLMDDAIQSLKADTNLRVMILRSMVPGIFSAGADLKERAKMKPEEVGPYVTRLRKALTEIQSIPVPTIVSLDGTAVGGGLEIALTCDMRVAADNTKMGLVEAKLAIIPGGGGTQNLARVVGPSKAKELIYTARLLTGEQAEKIGLVNHSVPQNSEGDGAYQRSLELAREIVPQGPIALKMAKAAINSGSEVDLQTAYTIEQLCYAQVIPTKDRIEGLTAFREKRRPVYKGE